MKRVEFYVTPRGLELRLEAEPVLSNAALLFHIEVPDYQAQMMAAPLGKLITCAIVEARRNGTYNELRGNLPLSAFVSVSFCEEVDKRVVRAFHPAEVPS